MAPAAVKLNRVLCLEESIWTNRTGLTDQTSVLPTLELLHRMGAIEQFVHRHAVGSTEFENYLSWRTYGRRARSFGTLYFAFHGTSAGLQVGDADYSLTRLAELIGELPGGVVHLGSCSVLKRNKAAAKALLKTTGARVVTGYESDVDWLDSAALDTAWLGYVATYARIGDAERALRRRYASLVEHLKWDAVTAKS